MCGLAEAVGSGLGLYGVQHTKGLQVFSRLIERSGLDYSVLDHFLDVHDQQWNIEDLFKFDVSRVAKCPSCSRPLHNL